MSVLDLIRPDLVSIQPYVINHEELDCKLHANELPWSPIAMANIDLNRYPASGLKNQLQMQLANYYQVKTDEIALTRGSDEGIDLLMRLFLRAGIDSIMQCPPTFPLYAFYAQLQQASVINCPLKEDDTGFHLDDDAIKSLWQPNCKLIMLCRPNNPTGTLIELVTIAKLCERFQNQSIIVVDEAYIEFSNAPSATNLIAQFDNLIVLRTLSKAYGLAGLRIGAVIAQPQIIHALQSVIAPFTLSSAVVDLGLRALKNKDWFVNTQNRLMELRQNLVADLLQIPWIDKIYPSNANFILVRTAHAQSLADWFGQQGIAVRFFGDNALLHHHLRITVGNGIQNARLLQAFVSFNGKS